MTVDSARFEPPAPLRARLLAMYAEPHRRYHSIAHIEALLRGLATWRHLAHTPRLIEAAIWFHDAVYDTRRQDNEACSAALARTELAALGWLGAEVERVAAMVIATQTHSADETDADTRLFLDLDLSVLGQRAESYDAYCRAVRAEFGWVDEARYRTGRARVLQRFLQREALYRTPQLHAGWEAAARDNLGRELQGLLAPGAGQSG